MTASSTSTEFATQVAGISTNTFLFVASDYKPRPGGIAAYIDSLARGLRSLGDETKVLAVVERDEKERIAFLENYENWVSPFQVVHDERPKYWLGSKVVSLLEIVRCLGPNARRVLEKTSFFRASSDSIARLEGILRKERPTMIVFGHLDLKLYPFALFFMEQELPYGILAHDFEVYRDSDKKNDLIRRGMMLKGAKWIAANSHHTKSLVEAWGIPSIRIRIVHPPISPEAIEASADTEQSRGWESKLKLVTICRLVRAKGIDIVIHALRILRGRGIDFQYVIAGDGGERGVLEDLVTELSLQDSVRFAGQVTEDDKWHLLRNSDIFVMPSRVDPKIQHEGFGISFIEAAAFGLPGVGTREGGIPDAVLDGETGILVPQESPESLAEALTFLYQNPEKRQEMGRAAKERARRQFSPTAVAAHFQREVSEGMI